MQATHDHYRPSKHFKKLILLCDHIVSPANQGAILRLADAFGLESVLFSGIQPDLSSSRLKKTARSTQNTVNQQFIDSPIQELKSLIDTGYQVIALEITQDSLPISKLNIASDKIVLIIGNEQNGITQDLLHIAAHQVHIPMYGTNSSMNVAQATAIALYQLTN